MLVLRTWNFTRKLNCLTEFARDAIAHYDGGQCDLLLQRNSNSVVQNARCGRSALSASHVFVRHNLLFSGAASRAMARASGFTETQFLAANKLVSGATFFSSVPKVRGRESFTKHCVFKTTPSFFLSFFFFRCQFRKYISFLSDTPSSFRGCSFDNYICVTS